MPVTTSFYVLEKHKYQSGFSSCHEYESYVNAAVADANHDQRQGLKPLLASSQSAPTLPSIHLMDSMPGGCLGPPSSHLVVKTNNHGSIEFYPLLLTTRLDLRNPRPPIPTPTRQSYDTYRTIQSPPFRGLGPFCPSCRWSRRSDNESRLRDLGFGYRKVDESLLAFFRRR